MKNRDWKRIILLVCSIVAMVLACMPNSVTVYMNSPEGEPIVAKVSYLTLVEDVKTGIALPTAVLVVSCIVGLLYTGGFFAGVPLAQAFSDRKSVV